MSLISKRKVTINGISIGKIIDLYRQGTFAIPEFQRDYVWKSSKAPKLLDSLWNHFPIGALLTWSTDDHIQSRVRSRVISPTQWIIDGQQRTRCLVKIMDGEILALFDVKGQRFLLENAATQKSQDPTLIPVSEIWGAGFTSILKNIEDIANSAKLQKEYEQRLLACRELLNREIPQVHLEGHNINEAIQAFERINTQGVRLKSTDIEVAELTVKHSGFVKASVQPYLDQLKSKGWERIYLSQLFMACEGIAEGGRKGDQRKRLHDLTKSELNSAWRYLTHGVNEAIRLLDDELGIKDIGVFPTGSMLMPIAVMLSGAVKQRPRTKDLVKWMIYASLTRRYSGSAQEKLDRDISACFEKHPIKALLKNNKRDAGRAMIAPNLRNFDSAIHDRYGMFLTYLACHFSGMKDLFDGRQVSTSSAEWHHIIPRASIHKRRRRMLDNPSNIAFIVGPTNRKISNSKAEVYLEKIDANLLASQCIPDEPSLWKSPKKFMRARALLMVRAIQKYLNSSDTLVR